MRIGPKMDFEISELVEATRKPIGFIYFANLNLIEKKPDNTENKTSIVSCK